jgi:hypothetical protein
MAEIGKVVTNQTKVGRAVAAAGRVHGPQATAAIGALGERLGVPAPPALSEVVSFFAALVEASGEHLIQTERGVVGELADDAHPRLDRDEAHRALDQAARRVRGIVLDIGGPGDAAAAALTTPPPATPAQLVEWSRAAATGLTKLDKVYETDDGVTVSTKVAAKALRAKADVLAGHLATVDTEARELESALGRRNGEQQAWRDIYQGTASIFEGFFRVGGLRDLAERVRPTERRARGDEAPEEPTQPTTDAAPAPAESPAPAETPVA